MLVEVPRRNTNRVFVPLKSNIRSKIFPSKKVINVQTSKDQEKNPQKNYLIRKRKRQGCIRKN